jgi:RNA polymerase sigma factor for flagellar operon FliA
LAVKTNNINTEPPLVDSNLADSVMKPVRQGCDHLKNIAHRKYSDHQKQKNDTEQMITDYLPMVQKIVNKVVSYLKPPLTYEDLISAGTVGLVKAAKDYDPARQAVFSTYAYIRVRGAVLDELRGWSFVPASVNKQISQAMQLSSEIAEETGSMPDDEELAEKLGISVEQLHKTYENARAKHFVSIDSSGTSQEAPTLGNLLAATNTSTPLQQMEKKEMIEMLARAIQQLEERERQLILLYYQQQLTMKEIAKVFQITEPRVSQLHAGALCKLSIKLRQWENGE